MGVKIPGVQQVINVGSAPNDGTGDPLRDAMIYINQNFTEVYSNAVVNTNISVGNTTVNASINSTSITISNGAAFISVGNTTVNNFVNSTSITISNSGAFVKLGNSSANAVINSTGFYTTATLSGANATLSTNTFTLGTSTDAAVGYTYLPNGFKMNWGWVSANSTNGDATFSSAFTTDAYSVTATSNSTVNTYQAAVIGTNNTIVRIRTANATSTNVFYMAIGK